MRNLHFGVRAEGLRNGAYIVQDLLQPTRMRGEPDLIRLASGSEVSLTLSAAERLFAEGLSVRFVSIPCWDLFDSQPESYRDQVLPPNIYSRLAVELGASLGWHRSVGDKGEMLCLDHFGASIPADILLPEFGFRTENIVGHAMPLLLVNSAETQAR